MMKKLLTILLILISTSILGQVNDRYDYSRIKSIKLTPTKFCTDSTNTLVYIKRNAEVYYKQSDIKEYIQQEIKRDKTYGTVSKELLELLNSGQKRIEITDLLYDNLTEKQVDSVEQTKTIKNYAKLRNHLLEFIGFDLIYEGKFMLYDPKLNKFLDKGIKGKRKIGKVGSSSFDYYMPNKKIFYSRIISIVK